MVVETAMILATILGITAIAAISFWPYILGWAHDTFFPWLKKHLPTLEQSVRDAFSWFDQKVAVPIRRTIKEAWKKLRAYLLTAKVKFKRLSSNIWEQQLTTYILVKETNDIFKQEVTEKAHWDNLPDDVREEVLRRGISDKEVNVTNIRDKEMEEVY